MRKKPRPLTGRGFFRVHQAYMNFTVPNRYSFLRVA
jgi:hypothetical protein